MICSNCKIDRILSDVVSCDFCSKNICVLCSEYCEKCSYLNCPECFQKHSFKCFLCEDISCSLCCVRCKSCGNQTCNTCEVFCCKCNSKLCEPCGKINRVYDNKCYCRTCGDIVAEMKCSVCEQNLCLKCCDEKSRCKNKCIELIEIQCSGCDVKLCTKCCLLNRDENMHKNNLYCEKCMTKIYEDIMIEVRKRIKQV